MSGNDPGAWEIIMTCPVLTCCGEIMEATLNTGDFVCIRQHCVEHGVETYRRQCLYIMNTATRSTAWVDVYISDEYLPGVDRRKLLQDVTHDPNKHAWLFTYARRTHWPERPVGTT